MKKTLLDLQESPRDYLTPEEVAPVLGANPQTIRVTARQHPELVGYPFTFLGNRMRIPKKPFLEFMGVD